MKTIAIIMAGGSGERFWPLSRCAYPKQLLKLKNNQHMLSMAIKRVTPLIDPADIYIITVAPLVDAIRRETPEIPGSNVIAEPEAKNTAACLTLASALVSQKYDDDPTVIVLTADHFIHDEQAFQRDCRAAIESASELDGLLTFGIRPNRAEIGYGYIEVGVSASARHPIFRVDSFREKPDKATAQRFLEDGDFFWNSGMFVWRNSVFQSALSQHIPAMFNAIPDMRQAFADSENTAVRLAEVYQRLEKISIDVGLMERAEKVYVLRASFDWDDIGTWASLYRVLAKDASGNAVFGNSVFLKSHDSIAYSAARIPSQTEPPTGDTSDPPTPRLVVGYNLEGIVIVNTPDAILVLPVEDVQNVKDVVAYLRSNGQNEYL